MRTDRAYQIYLFTYEYAANACSQRNRYGGDYMERIEFQDVDGSFTLKQADQYSGLYFPIAGENGLKGSVTPTFGGDTKWNQNAFLMEPVSIANLHNNKSERNFWCCTEDNGCWSAVGASAESEARKFEKEQDKTILQGSFMCQTVTRISEKHELLATVSSFVPVCDDVEIMQVKVKNTGEQMQNILPVAAIPIYGRSADNIRDHRHVTSLLHQIQTTKNGVYVSPTLSFDERGHQKNELTYFVCGVTGMGEQPVQFYPYVDAFIGQGGSLHQPRTLIDRRDGVGAGVMLEGVEALGGIRFEEVSLKPGETKSYTILMGITRQEEIIEQLVEKYATEQAVEKAKDELYQYWQDKVNVRYYTGHKNFDNFLHWVSFQPILRRIYGCSFLPHHDYGRGGRGWRDLWQDCLSLLLMDPSNVRQMIVDNYGGVRVDGTNATIIGEKQGEFVADRNGIARVWMDHGFWPFLTTNFYLNQTGDVDIILEQVPYFKDEQCERGTSLDREWSTEYGLQQKQEDGTRYEGTILEHILLENLCAFYEVGEHNHMRLRGADWNDALDMAEENGESVAFTCAYAGNLHQLAELLCYLKEQKGWTSIEVLKEIQGLLEETAEQYESIEHKRKILQKYVSQCKHTVSGQKIHIEIDTLIKNLSNKAQWIMEHVRKTEWIKDTDTQKGWFNSYYDNSKKQVEGTFSEGVHMMLTGQVFSIMSQTATEEQVAQICQSADQYLYEKEIGGYRLNTNFGEQKTDLGRMFGFAYGEKENGAVFSHMTVMYANALYQRGFVQEGYKALQSLADTAMDFETSGILPGIPEYFNSEGKGLYHYLTGAASWYMLTMVTQVFGVRGQMGDLLLEPKLVKQQFDASGCAELELVYMGRPFKIVYFNRLNKEYGEYQVHRVTCDGEEITDCLSQLVCLPIKWLKTLDLEKQHSIIVELV